MFLLEESIEMAKLLMVTFVALVAGTPLAYAGANGSNTERDGRHCTYVGERYDLCTYRDHRR
jgi:hypothetical protein